MGSKYTCDVCGSEIQEGDFIAILGEAPPAGLSMPIGRADKIFDDVGRTVCEACLPELVGEEMD